MFGYSRPLFNLCQGMHRLNRGVICHGSSWVVGTLHCLQSLCKFPPENQCAELLDLPDPLPISAKGMVLGWKSILCPSVPRDVSYAEVVDQPVVLTLVSGSLQIQDA